jgi:hypothetical protein
MNSIYKTYNTNVKSSGFCSTDEVLWYYSNNVVMKEGFVGFESFDDMIDFIDNKINFALPIGFNIAYEIYYDNKKTLLFPEFRDTYNLSDVTYACSRTNVNIVKRKYKLKMTYKELNSADIVCV